MPKKADTKEELHLRFTGKATFLVELQEYGPIEWRVDDMDTVLKMVSILLNNTDHRVPVNSYDKRTEKTFKRLLDF
jgi:hypothetical protein